jgi:hypothetical protein
MPLTRVTFVCNLRRVDPSTGDQHAVPGESCVSPEVQPLVNTRATTGVDVEFGPILSELGKETITQHPTTLTPDKCAGPYHIHHNDHSHRNYQTLDEVIHMHHMKIIELYEELQGSQTHEELEQCARNLTAEISRHDAAELAVLYPTIERKVERIHQIHFTRSIKGT